MAKTKCKKQGYFPVGDKKRRTNNFHRSKLLTRISQ